MANRREELIIQVADIAFDSDLGSVKNSNPSFLKRCSCDPVDSGLCYFCMNKKATKLADFIIQQQAKILDKIEVPLNYFKKEYLDFAPDEYSSEVKKVIDQTLSTIKSCKGDI